MERFKITKKVSILGILANLFLFVIKIVGGLIFQSQSMIADSFNSIGDVFASLMTFIGNKIASNRDDENHNFGHGKAEYIFSMFISISILVISIKLLYDTIFSLIKGNKVMFSFNLLIICLVTILIKLSLYFYLKKIYEKEKNILIKSNMIDHRNDIILTSGVLIAIICSKFNIYFVDSIVGILISIWFMLTGIKLFKDSYDVLMDVSLDQDTKDQIIKILHTNKFIKKIDDIHSVAVGYKYIVVLTISVDGNLNTFKSHDVANKIENDIVKSFDNIKEVFVHIHPI